MPNRLIIMNYISLIAGSSKTNMIRFASIFLLFVSTSVYSQPYSAGWRDFVNVTLTAGNTLTKTGGVTGTWDAGATSYNTLEPATDGYIQFTYATTTFNYMVSLSKNNNDASYLSVDFAFYVNGSTLQIFELGVNQGTFATLVNGDVLKISREGTSVKYYRNGTLLRTATQTVAQQNCVMRIDCVLSALNAVVPNVVASFDQKVNIQPSYTFPTLANNNGSISLNPEGGTAPYTYSWSSGETTSSISGKPRGTYTVTVTDAAGRSTAAPLVLGYPITWSNLSNVTLNADNSLSRTGTGTWAAGAFSRNRIEASTDGYIEFVLNDYRTTFMVGLSTMDRSNNYVSIMYALLVDINGSVNVYQSTAGYSQGTKQTSDNLPGAKKGDIFRVARVGSNVKFYRNGTEIYSMATVATRLFFDISISNTGYNTPVFTTDSDIKPLFKPVYTLPDASNANGAITLNPEGMYTPATYSWTPGGETTPNITGKSRGAYTVTLNDAASHSLTQTYRLGYPVMWTDVVNAKINSDNTISQTNGIAFAAGAISGNKLDANTDGWLEWVVPPSNGSLIIGLARQNNTTGATVIDYGCYLIYGADLRIYEGGTDRGLFANVVEGDVITISREGSNIKYYVNGVVVRTVATTALWELYVDTTFNNPNIPSPLIICSFNRTPQTYYSRQSGNWNAPATWSLTDGGPATVNYPVPGDVANIKGYTVQVTTGIFAPTINVNVTNNATSLQVDTGSLKVKGTVNVVGTTNSAAQTAVIVKNDGKIEVIP